MYLTSRHFKSGRGSEENDGWVGVGLSGILVPPPMEGGSGFTHTSFLFMILTSTTCTPLATLNQMV